MHRAIFCLSLTLGIIASSSSAFADEESDMAVTSAYRLCQIIDNTGYSSAPCEVSGWSGSVTATLDMPSSEARVTCAAMASKLREVGLHFPGRRQWTLQIVSPYSDGNSIAYCNLPK